MIKYNEIYQAIEGEGVWQGYLSYFIRFAGCNLECDFCDTDHKECGQKSPESIKNDIVEYFGYDEMKRVVITGGEPFLQQSMLIELISLLVSLKNCHIAIYTNGTYTIPKPIINHPQVHIILDYKVKDASKMIEENLLNMSKKDVLKFVIDKPDQLNNVRRIIEQYRATFMVTPSYDLINPMSIANKMIELKLGDIKLALQQHKYIYPPNMRGV